MRKRVKREKGVREREKERERESEREAECVKERARREGSGK